MKNRKKADVNQASRQVEYLKRNGWWDNPLGVPRDVYTKGPKFSSIYKKHSDGIDECIKKKNIKGARYHASVQAEMTSKGRLLNGFELRTIWNRLTKQYG